MLCSILPRSAASRDQEVLGRQDRDEAGEKGWGWRKMGACACGRRLDGCGRRLAAMGRRLSHSSEWEAGKWCVECPCFVAS